MGPEHWPLFIGRFQPFHNGHLAMVRAILEESNGVRFGIGSAQYEGTSDNPFSFDERRRMISAVMSKEGIDNFEILGIKDFHNDELWVAHLMDLVPDLKIAYSNDPLTIRLLSREGHDVRVLPLIERDSLSGTEVRRRMLDGKRWEELVPAAVREILMEIDAEARIQESLERESDQG